MAIVLAWVSAAGVLLAAVGAWRTEATVRWRARGERLRTDRARYEVELHRRRFAEVWQAWHSRPEGADGVALGRWYTEWTGAAPPLRWDSAGPMAPGVGCGDAGEAYDQYVSFLGGRYRLSPGAGGEPVTGPSSRIPGIGSRVRRQSRRRI